MEKNISRSETSSYKIRESLEVFYSFLWVIWEENATSYITTDLVCDLRPFQINGKGTFTSMGQASCRENKYTSAIIKGHAWIKIFCLYTRLSETKLHLQKE